MPPSDGAVAGAAVAAAADGELEAALAGRRGHAGDVVGAGDPRDREGARSKPLKKTCRASS